MRAILIKVARVAGDEVILLNAVPQKFELPKLDVQAALRDQVTHGRSS